MRVALAGFPFEIEPDGDLSPAERTWLARLDRSEGGPGFSVRLSPEPPWTSDDPALFPSDTPARIECDGADVLVGHASFTALVRPEERRATLFRRDGGSQGLRVTLRTALASRLPLDGGLPLHAAAAVVPGGRAVVLYGPSGAGKSTVSSRSPFPVLSDELVALVHQGDGFSASASGFWGLLDRESAPRGRFPVAAAFQLEKADRLDLDRLEPADALRRLPGVVIVPPSVPVWSAVLARLRSFVDVVPVFRLGWSLADDPWEAIAEASTAVSRVDAATSPGPAV